MKTSADSEFTFLFAFAVVIADIVTVFPGSADSGNVN
jgi:hypothetical protein